MQSAVFFKIYQIYYICSPFFCIAPNQVLLNLAICTILQNVDEISGFQDMFVTLSLKYIILRRDVHRIRSELREISDNCRVHLNFQTNNPQQKKKIQNWQKKKDSRVLIWNCFCPWRRRSRRGRAPPAATVPLRPQAGQPRNPGGLKIRNPDSVRV